MPYRLRMSAELGDWLAELRAAQPDTALRVAAALTLLLDSADLPGPPLVTDLFGGSMTDPDDQLAELQLAYRHLLETLTELRATTAMAGLRDATRVRIRRKGPSEVVPLTPEEVASLTPEEVAAADRRERALAAAVRHWSAAVQEFQHNQEIARASYRAATAARDAQRSIVSAPGLAESDRATAQAALAAASAQADTAATAMARLKARATAIRRALSTRCRRGRPTPLRSRSNSPTACWSCTPTPSAPTPGSCSRSSQPGRLRCSPCSIARRPSAVIETQP